MEQAPPTITPKGWESFQHYKDRKPAWIKLHRDLLDNYDFHRLPVASRALAPCLWLLASEYEGGAIPSDVAMIAFRLRMTEAEVSAALTPLIGAGFFIASSPLAGCKQVAILEKEIETEKERETDISPPDSPADAGPKDDPIPYQQVIDLYNQHCGGLFPKVSTLTTKRRTAIKARWKADPTKGTNTLDYWARYFGHCANGVDFFRKAASGELQGAHSGWKPNFDFLMTEKAWLGVREGKYQ